MKAVVGSFALVATNVHPSKQLRRPDDHDVDDRHDDYESREKKRLEGNRYKLFTNCRNGNELMGSIRIHETLGQARCECMCLGVLGVLGGPGGLFGPARILWCTSTPSLTYGPKGPYSHSTVTSTSSSHRRSFTCFDTCNIALRLPHPLSHSSTSDPSEALLLNGTLRTLPHTYTYTYPFPCQLTPCHEQRPRGPCRLLPRYASLLVQ